MKEFFHSIKFKILICVAALLAGLMTYVAINVGAQSGPEQILNTLTYPFTAAANWIADGVSGFIDKLVNADTYKSQNEELSAKLTEMYKHTMDYESLRDENEQLREMLGLKEKNKDFIFSEPCAIVARNANDLYGGFTISSGSSSGNASAGKAAGYTQSQLNTMLTKYNTMKPTDASYDYYTEVLADAGRIDRLTGTGNPGKANGTPYEQGMYKARQQANSGYSQSQIASALANDSGLRLSSDLVSSIMNQIDYEWLGTK